GDGARLTVERRGPGDGAADYLALSARCPHLGCRVSWNGVRGEYECPCHQGRFDATGEPLAGPPLEAGTPLDSYPLQVDEGRLFVLVPPSERSTWGQATAS
ncbi:MAG: Rieske (2Fe-2S) protein, partial [Deltaproteobacteria bacterium]|nr:Rieske (2Fe-2S) protein [Deltaproteobacteria bacterium]MBW2533528.1 Rieske (2Fe-2S) protein [Deltaproteobacteria bacterium]